MAQWDYALQGQGKQRQVALYPMGEERPVQRCKEKTVMVAAEGNAINSNVNELANEMWSYRVISAEFEIAWKESRKRQKTRVRDLKSVRKAEKVELLTSSAVSRKGKLRPRSQLAPQNGLSVGTKTRGRPRTLHTLAPMYQQTRRFYSLPGDGEIEQKTEKQQLHIWTHSGSFEALNVTVKRRPCKIMRLWWPHWQQYCTSIKSWEWEVQGCETSYTAASVWGMEQE